MSLMRRVARPMLASPFIAGGIEAIRNPATTSEVSGDAARGLASRIPQLAGLGPDMAVRVNGALMVGAGALLSLGRMPRLASLVLAATLVPPTVERAKELKAGAKSDDPALRAEQRKDLIRSVGVLGGLLIAVVDTGGRPSLSYQAQHLTGHAEAAAQRTARQARREVQHASREAKRVGKMATARLT